MFWRLSVVLVCVTAVCLLAACTLEDDPDGPSGSADDDLYTVVAIVDGDTIDVTQGAVMYRVRYVGVNTPERDEVCSFDATQANDTLVSGQVVRLEQDQSNTDRYGRLLRYVYVGDVFVNEQLIREGYAEVVLYEPDDRYFDEFSAIEQEAAQANLGCHATGIFNDGSVTR